MTTLVFPPSLTAAKIEFGPSRFVASNQSPYGQLQRVIRGANPWRASIQMPPLTGEDRAIWEAFMDEASRGDRHMLIHSHAYSQRGSFGSAELMSNPHFTAGTTGWTASGATLTAGSRLLRVQNSGAAEGYAYQVAALTAGDSIVVVADMLEGSVAAAEIEVYDVTGAAVIANATATAAGRLIVTATAVTTGNHQVRLKVNTSVSGNYVYYQQASVSKCALVNGVSQTGNKLNIDGLDVNTAGLLKIGDMFCVYVDSVPHLARLTRDLDSNASGLATAFFEPALPGSPANNAAVIIRRPFARFFNPLHGHSGTYTPPNIGAFSFDCIEDITR